MTKDPDRDNPTRFFASLSRSEQLDSQTVSRMFVLVYDELRGMARRLTRGRPPGSTLRPTALVHEAFVRLVEQEGVTWEGRAHFFGIAARAMRQILVDHARERSARKRGGALTRVTLDEGLVAGSASEYDILDLERALENLARLDPRATRVVELRVFGGLGMEEIAHVLGISRRTAYDDWCMARMFLTRELEQGA